MVDFAAYFTIHATIIGFKNGTFSWKVLSLKVVHLPIACQSERSLRYFHLGRISDLFSIDLLRAHTLPAAEKRFRVT